MKKPARAFTGDPDWITIGVNRVRRENLVVGVHPILLAEKAGLLRRLFVRDDETRPELLLITTVLSKAGVVTVDESDFDRALLPDGHQHLAGEIIDLPNPDIERIAAGREPALVILLDGVTDPGNAGAIIRTAAAAGARAVVLPVHRSVGPSPALYKASAGLAFTIPLCRVTNLRQALDALAKHGFWSVGAGNAENATPLQEFAFPEKCALVLGSEDKGVRTKLYEHCDFRVRIPMAPRVESLNVSVAAGVLSYAWLASRGFAPLESARGEK